MKRLRSHRTQTADGKIFVSFLALIVQVYLLKQLKDYMQKNNLTLHNILLELDKMKAIQHPGGHAPRLLNLLTRRQREIYDALAIPAPDCIG